MPVLSWRHANGASMTRCSQPLVGILWARSLADEKLLESIRQLNPSTQSPLKIVDCRSLISAYANKAKRGGTESLTYYKNCAIEFMGIDNIHVMRESMRCVEHWTTEQTRRPSDLTWLQHVSCVLTAACKIAKELDQGTSVLIHCSDGWDRTAQLSSLVQILLDPYFRTLEGFLVLIEKEWVSPDSLWRDVVEVSWGLMRVGISLYLRCNWDTSLRNVWVMVALVFGRNMNVLLCSCSSWIVCIN